ncbi:MAG TPA: glycerol-3-phosphate 1-O-acyltransferase PlsY [Verrucomicrobiae bacterium]|nr:glycerol-3-phosphate 1-O-acyltransferase PlsY [Verrucomicrobiae bacterium]
MVGYCLCALIGYLLGSIPSGFLAGKTRGIDIRKTGSGNIGATNVFRTQGMLAGILVLLADAFKGWVAVTLAAGVICNSLYPAASPLEREWFEITAGLSAILGHNYTCWLGFRGGKGIATSAGVLAALVPLALIIILVIWAVVLLLTCYVSLASMIASFALPFAAWLTGRSTNLIVVTAAMAALAIFKHKSNIQRLLNGTENRFGRKGQPAGGHSPESTS